MFHNSYNCINHVGVLCSQCPFGDPVGKKPASYRNQTTNLQFKSTYWFLDVLLIRKNETLETTINRKSTNDGVYLH